MKTIAIGDIHGETWWEDIIKKEKPNKVIFIGDYFDSFHIPHGDQVVNFKKIMEIEEESDNNIEVIRLIGNHDIHYLYNKAACSGFSHAWKDTIYDVLNKNLTKFKLVHNEEGILFSHAGISETWLTDNNLLLDQPASYYEDNINSFFKNKEYDKFLFKPYSRFRHSDPYGDNIYQSLLWIRPMSLVKDKLPLIQVVGHTKNNFITEENGIFFIDTNGREYLKFEKGNTVICKL